MFEVPAVIVPMPLAGVAPSGAVGEMLKGAPGGRLLTTPPPAFCSTAPEIEGAVQSAAAVTVLPLLPVVSVNDDDVAGKNCAQANATTSMARRMLGLRRKRLIPSRSAGTLRT